MVLDHRAHFMNRQIHNLYIKYCQSKNTQERTRLWQRMTDMALERNKIKRGLIKL